MLTVPRSYGKYRKAYLRFTLMGNLQDFLPEYEGISTHERVSKVGINKVILCAKRGEEDESDNEDNEEKEYKEEKKKLSSVHFIEIF